MQTPEIYNPTAEMLAMYCQSDHSLIPRTLLDNWLPPEINTISEGWGEVSESFAKIEMGGGFYHLNYRLIRDDDKSNSETNTWNLYLQSETLSSRLLVTLKISKKKSFSKEVLLEKKKQCRFAFD